MKKLNLVESSTIIGGASKGRCRAMAARLHRRGSGMGSRLGQRLIKNCYR